MTLTTCKECHKPVSRQADKCPHCGALLNMPARVVGAILGALPAIAVLWLLVRCSASEPPPPKKDYAAERAATVACQADLTCWAQRHSWDAASACKPQIERYALHSARWTAPISLLFSSYGWSSAQHIAIVYVGGALELQNGFGAWTPMVYSCTYAPDGEKVIAVSVAEGRL